MDRLLREGNPPAGQLASPKPQYKDVQTNNWEELKGEGGASYVKDKAVLAKLADLESELATIKANQLSGDQKVQLSGTLTELFGAHLSDRPPANSVSVGATFMVVGDTVVYQSNGTDWVVISE